MERSRIEYKGVLFDYTRMSEWILLTACHFIDDTTHVEIPAAIAGCPVAHLRDHLFQDCRNMESWKHGGYCEPTKWQAGKSNDITAFYSSDSRGVVPLKR